MKIEGKKILHTDVLIIGGGTAGCYAAMTIREQSDYSIIIAEKSQHQAQRLSGSRSQRAQCLYHQRSCSAGLRGLRHKDADGIVRPDLLFDHVRRTQPCDRQNGTAWSGHLKRRKRRVCGKRKPQYQDQRRKLQAASCRCCQQINDVTVINQLNITDYLVNNNKIEGAVGFSIADGTAYEIRAKRKC